MIDMTLSPSNYSFRIFGASILYNTVGFTVLDRIGTMITLPYDLLLSGLPIALAFSSFFNKSQLSLMNCWWKSATNASDFTTLIVAFSVPEFAASEGLTAVILRLSSHTWSLRQLRSIRVVDQDNQSLRLAVIDIQNLQVVVEGKRLPRCTLSLNLPGIDSPLIVFTVINVPIPTLANITSMSLNEQLYASVGFVNFWSSAHLTCTIGLHATVIAQFISPIQVICPLSSGLVGNGSVSVSTTKLLFPM